jgi:alkanesulfonate monooxygenase SsuD/methylene tetrahydromethanopterin reductase-like flavin-dependent oxidoreductase (luciferase family)
LTGQKIYPPLGAQGLTTWVGVGGSPESVVRVVRHDLQLMLAIIGGDPRRFAPYIDLYTRACAQLGRQPRPIGIHSPGFIAQTDEEAIDTLWPAYQAMFGRIGRERGWPPTTKQRYLDEVRDGSLYVGSPETVAQKIARTLRDLGVQRFDMKYSTGPIPHHSLMRCIEMYGTRVIPRVQDLLTQ